MTGEVLIGLDIGQKVDPTAIAVTEAIEADTGRMIHAHQWHRENGPIGFTKCGEYCYPETEDRFVVRDLGRLKLGTPYPDVADHVAKVVARLNDRGIRPRLVADATGVGTPVVDIIRRSLTDHRVDITEATFTAGERFEGGWRSRISVPKVFLVSRLQALLATKRIRLPETREARTLARELGDYEIRVTDTANLVAGAFRTGAHDDMVTALGLSVLIDPSARRIQTVPSPYRS